MKWGLAKNNNSSNLTYDSLFKKNIDRLFDDFFSTAPTSFYETEWLPTIDIEEDEKTIQVKAEIPGLEEKNLNISLEKNILIISGEKREEKKEEDKNKKYVISERKFGSFSRSITLPEGIKQEGIKAKFKDGVLDITIPKDEKSRSKKIEIKIK